MIFSNETTEAVGTLGGTDFTTAGGTVLTRLGKVMGTEKERRSGYLSGKPKRLGVSMYKGNKEKSTVQNNVKSTGKAQTDTILETKNHELSSDESHTSMYKRKSATGVKHVSFKPTTDKLHTQDFNDEKVSEWSRSQEEDMASCPTPPESDDDSEDDRGAADPALDNVSSPMDWAQMDQNDAKPNTTATSNTGDKPMWTTVHNKKRQTVIYNAEETDTRIKDSVKTIMRHRGDRAVEKVTDKDTPVQVEFKVSTTTKSFNLREALGKLLTTMLAADPSVTIQDKDGSNTWNDPNELPVGNSMNDHFVIRQDSPPYEKPKITIYFTIKSTLTVNDIKYSPHVLDHLKTYNIFLRPDRFHTAKVRSPGYFVDIAPRLIWKQDFTAELKKGIALTTFDDTNPVFREYYRDNNVPPGQPTPPLPPFYTHVNTRKFGKVSAEVLTVTCAADDALYLKKILSTMAEQNQIRRGKFIPTGLHLITGPATVVNLLRNQNSYMDKLTVIPIEGIKSSVMDSGLSKRIMLDNKGILSIERTSTTDEKGKWFVIITKTTEDSFQDYLDTTLKELLKNAPEDSLIEGYDAPRRAGAQKSANVLGSYAAILRKTINPTNSHKPHAYNAPTHRPRKRAHTNVILTHDTNTTTQGSPQRTYASMVQDTATNTTTHWDVRPPLFSNKSQALSQDDSSLTKETMDEMESRIATSLEEKLTIKLQERLEEMKTTLTTQMDKRMTTLSATIENNITTIIQKSLEDLTTSMQTTLTNQVSHMMQDLTNKITTMANTTKRTSSPIASPPSKQQKNDIPPNGQGSQHNTTSTSHHNTTVSAMQS